MVTICTCNQLDSPILVLPNDPNFPISNNNFVSSTTGYTVDSELMGYCITVGRKYNIYGVLSYDNHLYFLTADDNGIPGFFPSDLFRMDVPLLSIDWALKSYKIEEHLLIAIGPLEFVDEYENIRDLIDGKKQAISWFLKYKEFSEYYGLCCPK